MQIMTKSTGDVARYKIRGDYAKGRRPADDLDAS